MMIRPISRLNCITLRRTAVIVALACCTVSWRAAHAAPTSPAMLIRLDEQGRLEVVPVDRQQLPNSMAGQGLLVYSDQGQQRWQVLPPEQSGRQTAESERLASRFVAISRGEDTTLGESLAMTTTQLDQLLGRTVIRGTGLLTPTHGGHLLHPQMTIRRQPESGATKYPAARWLLCQGARTLMTIDFREGQSTIRWRELPDVPDAYQKGLTPGEYTLRTERGGQGTMFIVDESELRDWVLMRSDELTRLLGSRDNPLCLQVAVEELLFTGTDGQSPPYLADALDLLESADAKQLTPYLRRVHRNLLDRLAGKQPVAIEDEHPTGIAAIDEARQCIAEGNWRQASETLTTVQNGSGRARALAILYQAVILAESARATQPEAEGLFREAIKLVQNGPPADAYRAHNNYANFLLGRAQDRLYNHAFLIAAGVDSPLVEALDDWREALGQYEKARHLAADLDEGQQAAVETNMARLYCLLADVVRTLDSNSADQRRFEKGEQAAVRQARELAERVAQRQDSHADPETRAVATEILAHLAFRGGDGLACAEHARAARAIYLRCGCLAGVESIERMEGLAILKDADFVQGFLAKAPSDQPVRKQALKHLLVAHQLAELFRERIPEDAIGLSRAGFLARRAYVNERIVELLIEDGQPREALHYAELAKARALQDVLAARGDVVGLPPEEPGDLDMLLEHWPENVAALEYFLGSEHAWLFLIDTGGTVSVYALKDERGEPVASRRLVAQVTQFLSGLNLYADKMRRRLMAGRGFQHTWQDELHAFYRQLLPEAALAKLRSADTVLIVPHHVLHYFPFVALVIQPDRQPRGEFEMVQPKFLLDEPFCLCYAPSLATWASLRQRPDEPVTDVTAAGIVEFDGAAPLPGVEEDLKNLQAAFAQRVRSVLPADQATEDRAGQLFRRRGMLFLGTHGRNLADEPLASYLLFHADPQNDGYLTAAELYTNEVGADLVVLSACYSGLADRSPLPGDDLFGLQRALLHAGSRTVVAGLWDVYDGTGPELMQGLFVALAAGRSAPQALAASQRGFLARLRDSDEVEPWLHPYFWAVYNVVGDDRIHCEEIALRGRGTANP